MRYVVAPLGEIQQNLNTSLAVVLRASTLEQFLYDGAISVGKGELREFSGINPFPAGAAQSLRWPGKIFTLKYVQSNTEVSIGMFYLADFLTNFNPYVKLFCQFSRKTFREAFAIFLLASGEFPEASQESFFFSLGDEQAIFIPNQTGRNMVMWDRFTGGS